MIIFIGVKPTSISHSSATLGRLQRVFSMRSGHKAGPLSLVVHHLLRPFCGFGKI